MSISYTFGCMVKTVQSRLSRPQWPTELPLFYLKHYAYVWLYFQLPYQSYNWDLNYTAKLLYEAAPWSIPNI